jgi:hypothetical protein
MVLPIVMGTVGGAVGLIIGILIFSSVATNVQCPNATSDPQGNTSCNNAKNTAWTVLGILPVGLFFGLFYFFRMFQ